MKLPLLIVLLNLFAFASLYIHAIRGHVAHLLAAASILLLGILQVDFILANHLNTLFIYSFSTESIYQVSCIFAAILFSLHLSSWHLSRITRFTSFNDQHRSLPSFRVNLLSLIVILVSMFALFSTNKSVDDGMSLAGRGTISGIGIIISFLTSSLYFIFRNKTSSLTFILSVISALIVLYLSRIFFIALLCSVSAQPIRRLSSYKRFFVLVLLAFSLLIVFFVIGQVKHSLGFGLSLSESLDSLSRFNPFEDSGTSALGVNLTYSIGIEVASSTAACLSAIPDTFSYDNIASFFNSLLSSLFPSFARPIISPILDINIMPDCNTSIVQPALQELYKAFDVIGVLILVAVLGCVCFVIDLYPYKQISFYGSSTDLFLFLPIFLVRGSLGLCVSISLGSIVSLFLIRLFSIARIFPGRQYPHDLP